MASAVPGRLGKAARRYRGEFGDTNLPAELTPPPPPAAAGKAGRYLGEPGETGLPVPLPILAAAALYSWSLKGLMGLSKSPSVPSPCCCQSCTLAVRPCARAAYTSPAEASPAMLRYAAATPPPATAATAAEPGAKGWPCRVGGLERMSTPPAAAAAAAASAATSAAACAAASEVRAPGGRFS